MQIIENVYELARDDILRIEQQYAQTDEIPYIIKRFSLAQAFECAHIIECAHIVDVDESSEDENPWHVLKIFIQKTDEKKNLLLQKCNVAARSHSDINSIIEILSRFKNVTNLEWTLKNIECGTDEICTLKKYFDNRITIKNLKLESDYQTIFNIMESIEACESIETIDLKIVDIRDVINLIPISIAHKIKKIHFFSGSISTNYAAFNMFFEHFLALNPQITELNLSNMCVNTDTVRIISTFIATHDDLATLSIRNCTIGSERAGILAEALKMSNVKTLNVSDNPMPYQGVIEILKVLAVNTTVSTFHCTSATSIDKTLESIVQIFEQILSDNYTLTDFFVRLGDRYQICIELKNITNRNKEANNNLRFIKAKVASG